MNFLEEIRRYFSPTSRSQQQIPADSLAPSPATALTTWPQLAISSQTPRSTPSLSSRTAQQLSSLRFLPAQVPDVSANERQNSYIIGTRGGSALEFFPPSLGARNIEQDLPIELSTHLSQMQPSSPPSASLVNLPNSPSLLSKHILENRACAVDREVERLGEIENLLSIFWSRVLQNPHRVIDLEVDWIRDPSGAVVVEEYYKMQQMYGKVGFRWQLTYLDGQDKKKRVEATSSFYCALKISMDRLDNQFEKIFRQIYLISSTYLHITRQALCSREPPPYAEDLLSSGRFHLIDFEKISSEGQSLQVKVEVGDQDKIFSLKFTPSPLPKFILSGYTEPTPKSVMDRRAIDSIRSYQERLHALDSSGQFMPKAYSFLQAHYKPTGERDFRAEAQEVLEFFKDYTNGNSIEDYSFSEEQKDWYKFLFSVSRLEEIITKWPEKNLLPKDRKLESTYFTLCGLEHQPQLKILRSILEIKSYEIQHLRDEPTEVQPLLSETFRKKTIEEQKSGHAAGRLASHVRSAQEEGIIDVAQMQILQKQIIYLQDVMACFNAALLQPDSFWAYNDLSIYRPEKWKSIYGLHSTQKEGKTTVSSTRGQFTQLSSTDYSEQIAESLSNESREFPIHFGWTVSESGQKEYIMYHKGERVAFTP